MLIVGLGNPGTYRGTRHNIGRDFLQWWAHEVCDIGAHAWQRERFLHASVVWCSYKKGEHMLALPETYMNASGEAVTALLAYVALPAAALVVIHDELDLPLGAIRVSKAKGDGGHRGVADIIRRLGTAQFTRVRIGIAPTAYPRPRGEKAVSDFVLQHFSSAEQEVLDEVYARARLAVEQLLVAGEAAAANAVNHTSALTKHATQHGT